MMNVVKLSDARKWPKKERQTTKYQDALERIYGRPMRVKEETAFARLLEDKQLEDFFTGSVLQEKQTWCYGRRTTKWKNTIGRSFSLCLAHMGQKPICINYLTLSTQITDVLILTS